MKEIENDRLIVRYFTGEATPDETKAISGLLVSDPGFRDAFEEYRRVWLLTTRQSVSGLDTDKEWSLLANRIKTTPDEALVKSGKVPVRRLLTLRNIAASLIILIAFSASLLYIYSGRLKEVVAEVSGQELTLPDGSTVILHEGAKLSYPASFSKKERNVTLDGEAFFTVAHDAARPFIVSGGDVNIKVLGTEFNVSTNTGNHSVSVVLEKGKVSVYLKGEETNNVLLTPGEKAVADINTRKIHTSVNTDPNYKAWITRELVFNNSSLSIVAETLQRVYGKEIRLANSAMQECILTATFKDQSLPEVLDVISATLGTSVTIKDNVIYFDGNCH